MDKEPEDLPDPEEEQDGEESEEEVLRLGPDPKPLGEDKGDSAPPTPSRPLIDGLRAAHEARDAIQEASGAREQAAMLRQLMEQREEMLRPQQELLEQIRKGNEVSRHAAELGISALSGMDRLEIDARIADAKINRKQVDLLGKLTDEVTSGNRSSRKRQLLQIAVSFGILAVGLFTAIFMVWLSRTG